MQMATKKTMGLGRSNGRPMMGIGRSSFFRVAHNIIKGPARSMREREYKCAAFGRRRKRLLFNSTFWDCEGWMHRSVRPPSLRPPSAGILLGARGLPPRPSPPLNSNPPPSPACSTMRRRHLPPPPPAASSASRYSSASAPSRTVAS
jgi:hypothetical protein